MIHESAMREILEFHIAAGADEAIGNAPVSRYAMPQVKAPFSPPVASGSTISSPAQLERAPASVSPCGDVAIKSAYTLARAAGTVETLREALEAFDGCALRKTATNTVFYDGNPQARIVFVGEAPGAEEDRQGLPFVGQSGKLLDRMLASIGLNRENVLITNTVFWRPPGNRTPTTGESAICQPFLERLLELVDPEFLVALGGPAAKALLAETQGITRLRGKWLTYSTPGIARPVQAIALFHPAYLLRTPTQKRLAWRDLMDIRQRLNASK